MSAEVTSMLGAGTVRTDRSRLLVPFWSCTGWLRESFLPTTCPGTLVTARRLFSQLTGPLKWTLHGLIPCPAGHVATVLVGSMLQPAAARALTRTGTPTFCRGSTVTAIGGGFCTSTSAVR